MRHVLRGEHQTEGGAAERVPALRPSEVERSRPLGALVTEHSQQEEQQQERVFLPNPVDRDRVDVERPDRRGNRAGRGAEEQIGDAKDDEGRRCAGDGVRHTERGFERNRPVGWCDPVPRVGQADAPPHRELHQHRVLGVRAEATGTVLLDRVNLVDFVFAQTVGRQRADSERERQDGRRHDDELRARLRSQAMGASVGRPTHRVGPRRRQRLRIRRGWHRDWTSGQTPIHSPRSMAISGP